MTKKEVIQLVTDGINDPRFMNEETGMRDFIFFRTDTYIYDIYSSNILSRIKITDKNNSSVIIADSEISSNEYKEIFKLYDKVDKNQRIKKDSKFSVKEKKEILKIFKDAIFLNKERISLAIFEKDLIFNVDQMDYRIIYRSSNDISMYIGAEYGVRNDFAIKINLSQYKRLRNDFRKLMIKND